MQESRGQSARSSLSRATAMRFNNNDLENQFQQFAQNFRQSNEKFDLTLQQAKKGMPARVRSALFSNGQNSRKPSTVAGARKYNKSNISKPFETASGEAITASELNKSKSGSRLKNCQSEAEFLDR